MRSEQRLVGDLLQHADSLGVTWLTIDTSTGLRLRVIAVTRIDMLKSSSATWPWLSPKGPSGSSRSVSIKPSMTISASAGTSRSTVLQRTIRTGSPDQTAGHADFVLVDGQFLRAGEEDGRRASDDDRAGHRFAALLVFQPMQISAGAAEAASHPHTEPIVGFQRGPIGTHISDAVFRISGDAERCREVRRGVEAGRRYGNGRLASPPPSAASSSPVSRLPDRMHPR